MSENTPSLKMTSDEMNYFLSQTNLARLATIRGDKPHVTPIWYIWDGKSIWMETLPSYLKVRNLRANPACSISIDSTEGGLRIKGVIFEGSVELIDQPEVLVMKIVRQIYIKYMGEEALIASMPKKMLDGPHILIKLSPRKTISWNWTHKEIASLN